MEVVGSPPIDHFDFNYGARNYLSAPSSPKRFGEFCLSAPTSPSRISEFYSEFECFSISPSKADQDGFAFFVNGETEQSSRSAEELFDGGKIKPLKEDSNELLESARSPLLSPKRSPLSQGKKVIREAFSPRKKIESDDNPFEARRRGRDRTPAPASVSSSESGRRVTRSHSPYRISHQIWEEEPHQQPESNKEDINKASLSSTSSSSASKSCRKWRFMRDFLLFRSASEGRGSSKDPFRKYPILFKKPEEGKASSFRSSEIPKSRRKEPVSAHELHYARKKAETEDLKKRTFLPYKQGILGRLAGFGSLTR